MKKKLVLLCLFSVIFLCGVFIWAKLSSISATDNFFNTHLRSWATKHALTKSLLQLHFDGDNFANYLGQTSTSIEIRVFTMDGLELSPNVVQEFASTVSHITGRQVVVTNMPDHILYLSHTNYNDRTQLVVPHLKDSSRNSLNVFVLSQDEKQPTLLGVTFQDVSVVVFSDSIRSFTESVPKSFDPYVLSTLLHEFGHQIALPHNTTSGCLMTEHAELDQNARQNVDEVVTTFCPEELTQIEKIKASMK